MPQRITESLDLAAQATGTAGRIRIKIIDAGEGSSGVYPPETIEQAVKDKVFAKGLHMFIDHPGETESYDRPERTIKDLAAVLESDAVWVAEENAAYADAKVFPHWREVITEMAADIGVSIRAYAEAEDKDGQRTVTRLLEALSVDFVTKAGRGGAITEVLESSRAATRAVKRHGVEEATANNLRDWLRLALRDGGDSYRYVIDFDESTVWFNSYDDDGAERYYQQSYTVSRNTATLIGDPVEVRIETRYVPVTQAAESAPADSPSDPAGVTENRKEPTVATTQIEESELSQLRDNAGRVTALETENDTLRRQVAESAVAREFDGIDAPRLQARLVESALRGETFDVEALEAEARESAAEIRAARGEGQVNGVGQTEPVQEARKTFTDDDIVAALNGGK